MDRGTYVPCRCSDTGVVYVRRVIVVDLKNSFLRDVWALRISSRTLSERRLELHAVHTLHLPLGRTSTDTLEAPPSTVARGGRSARGSSCSFPMVFSLPTTSSQRREPLFSGRFGVKCTSPALPVFTYWHALTAGQSAPSDVGGVHSATPSAIADSERRNED